MWPLECLALYRERAAGEGAPAIITLSLYNVVVVIFCLAASVLGFESVMLYWSVNLIFRFFAFVCGLSVQHGRSEPQEKVLHQIEDAEGDGLLKLQPCPEGRSLEPLEDGPEDE